MSRYILLGLPTDPNELLDEAYQELEANVPGFRPSPGDVVDIVGRKFAEMVADVASTLTNVPQEIFRFSGRGLDRVLPLEPTFATGTATFTAIDADGATVDDGLELAGRNAGGELVTFRVAGDHVIAADTTEIAGVPVAAAIEGAAGNGVVGAGELITQHDRLASTVVFDAATSNGSDGETDQDYLDRLAEERRLGAPRLIRAEDAQVFARRIPGVGRALVIDGLNPITGEGDLEKTFAVFAIDPAGADINGVVEGILAADLQARRERNIDIFIAKPDRTPVAVAYAATAWKGWDPPAVKPMVDAAIAAHFSSAIWGRPPFGGVRDWENETVIDIGAVEARILAVDGVRRVPELTLNGNASDITMAGHATLPTLTTVTGTVTGA